jgi:hypothetical protein
MVGNPMTFPLLVLARARELLGAREDSGGQHRGQIVRASMAGTVRAGRLTCLGDGSAWCAGFAGRCLFDANTARALAWTPLDFGAGDDSSPVGWRAAVSELCDDARATSMLREDLSGGWTPSDLLIFGRAGENPLHGGLGHVAIVDALEPAGGTWTIGGDEAGAGGIGVRRTLRPTTEEPLVAWIQVARS